MYNIPLKLLRKAEDGSRALCEVIVPFGTRSKGDRVEVTFKEQTGWRPGNAPPLSFDVLRKRGLVTNGMFGVGRAVDNGTVIEASRAWVISPSLDQFGTRVFPHALFCPFLPERQNTLLVARMMVILADSAVPFTGRKKDRANLLSAIATPRAFGECGFVLAGQEIYETGDPEDLYVEQPAVAKSLSPDAIVDGLYDSLTKAIIDDAVVADGEGKTWKAFPYCILPVEPGEHQSRISAMVSNQAFLDPAEIIEGDDHPVMFLDGYAVARVIMGDYHLIDTMPIDSESGPRRFDLGRIPTVSQPASLTP